MSVSRILMCIVLCGLSLSDLWGTDPDLIGVRYVEINGQRYPVNRAGQRIDNQGRVVDERGRAVEVDRENAMDAQRTGAVKRGVKAVWEATNQYFEDCEVQMEKIQLLAILGLLQTENANSRGVYKRIVRNDITNDVIDRNGNYLDDAFVALYGPGMGGYPPILQNTTDSFFSITTSTRRQVVLSQLGILARIFAYINNVSGLSEVDQRNLRISFIKNLGDCIEDGGTIVCRWGKWERNLRTLQGILDGINIDIVVNQGEAVEDNSPSVMLRKLGNSVGNSVGNWVLANPTAPYAKYMIELSADGCALGGDVMRVELDNFKNSWVTWSRDTYGGDNTAKHRDFVSGLNSKLKDYYDQIALFRPTVQGGMTGDQFHAIFHGACPASCDRLRDQVVVQRARPAEVQPDPLVNLSRQRGLNQRLQDQIDLIYRLNSGANPNDWTFAQLMGQGYDTRAQYQNRARANNLAAPGGWLPNMGLVCAELLTPPPAHASEGTTHQTATTAGGNRRMMLRNGQWVPY